ncbi:replication factor A protein [Halorhabdus tiamatea SARL4B]|uniref:Replication factor A protein n=1 Tax=Halorhabdus tiamatea SARL4B TaxID=1033806 RepID=F7PMM4_9EURY|nr:replication protein A [Halorhabdus tiamatea]ERJ07421.1 replication factor A protein [Halorhabdus tiamatea SARL4B]
MTEPDLDEQAADVHDQLPDDVEATVEEIKESLTTLVGEYHVPLDEARRSVVSNYLDDSDSEPDDLGGNDEVSIEEIDEPEDWVDLTAKVVDIWEPRSDAIGQVGLLGDDTGRIKFTAWAKSDLPDVTEGEVYHFSNVVTDEYEGRYSVKLNKTTSIEQLEEDIEVGDDAVEVEGALVDIQQGSGLIKRCPEEDCTRVLQNGRCSEHGEVEGEFDLRIKGVIDDGSTVQKTIFDQEATEEMAGIPLDEAKDMAMDALDTSVVGDQIRDDVLGQYYRVKGPEMGQFVLVNEAEQIEEAHDSEEILIKARSI